MMPLFSLMLLGCGAPVATTVAEAPEVRGSALEIQDGVVQLDALAAYDRDCKGSKPVTNNRGGSHCVEHHFYVAPIRTDAGGSGEVSAWVTCPTKLKDVEACRAWLADHPGATGRVLWRFDADGDTGWAKAIKESGLSTVDRAPVVLIE